MRLIRKDKDTTVVTEGGYFSWLVKSRVSFPCLHLSVFMTALQKQSPILEKEVFRWIVWWEMSLILLPNGIMSLHENGQVGRLVSR